MALPVGVTTATCTVGVPVSFTGAANIRANVSVKPSVFLVHAATGTPLVDMLESIDTTDGVAGQFTLPHTDQAGFVDENQNVYTNWFYTVTIQYSNDRQVMLPKTKVFQLTTGQSLVDLDQLPSGVPALPYTAPSATVSAFGGRTGAVTLQESDLPQRLSVEDLSATIDDQIEGSTYLPDTYANVTGARPGNRIAYLGDSITQAAWITGTGYQGSSFPLYTMLVSGGRLVVAANAGVSGNTTAAMLARFDADIAPSVPTAVVILGGTNDVGGVVTLAEYAANIKAIVVKTRGIGAVPVLCTIPPSNTAAKHPKINLWNAWLRRYASVEGITIIDFYSALVDTANGNYAAAYNTDGTHPNAAGYLMLGTLVSSALSPLSPLWAPYMSADNVDSLNILSATNSVTITENGSNGYAAGWFGYGGSSGFAHALVTDSLVPGKLQQITQTANADARILTKDLAAVAVGDRLALSGVVTSSGGVQAEIKATFNGAGSAVRPAIYTAAVTRGVYYQEAVVPAGTTSVTIDLVTGSGTGVVAYGQTTVVNLTANAILTA